jgi:hypothetical protein
MSKGDQPDPSAELWYPDPKDLYDDIGNNPHAWLTWVETLTRSARAIRANTKRGALPDGTRCRTNLALDSIPEATSKLSDASADGAPIAKSRQTRKKAVTRMLSEPIYRPGELHANDRNPGLSRDCVSLRAAARGSERSSAAGCPYR